MKLTTTILIAVFSVALVNSIPVPDNQALRSQILEQLMMAEGENQTALRSKRTIGILRQLFPGLSQIIEQKVNAITSEVVKALGPILVRSVLGGGARQGGDGNNGKTNDAGTTVEIASPFDDEDDDDASSSSNGNNKLSSTSKSGSKISISLPTFPPDEDEDEATESPTTSTTITSSSTSSSIKSAMFSDANREAEDRLAEEAAESQNNEVRVQFADDQTNASANEAVESELAPLDDIEVSDDENRNKRFLNFGFGASGGAGAGSGGSGTGSGNFLFDIIRQAADGAARAAGTVYRVVAGTQSLGLGVSASRDVGPAPAPAAPAPSGPAANAGAAPAGAPTPAAAPAPGAGTQPPLVAGSGSSQQDDVAAGAPTPGRNDGTTEAVPGPVTRLFVIANRGISNLIQDLILRLAATSERIVNFKARLITSII